MVHVAEVIGGRSMFILSSIDFLEPIGNFPYDPSGPSSVAFYMKHLPAWVLRVFSVFLTKAHQKKGFHWNEAEGLA